jgi:hypothetical protein
MYISYTGHVYFIIFKSATTGHGIQNYMMNMKDYFQTKLNEHDVLFARGNGANDSIGNKRYRKEIRDHKLDYQNNARNNKEKELIARKVMRKIQLRGGRFLHYPDSRAVFVGDWCDAPDNIVLSKVKQALREKKKNATPLQCDNSSNKMNNRAMKDTKKEENKSMNPPRHHVSEQEEDNDDDHNNISLKEISSSDNNLKEDNCDNNSISIEDITDDFTNNYDESLIELMSCSSFQKEVNDNDYNCHSTDDTYAFDAIDKDIEDDVYFLSKAKEQSIGRERKDDDNKKSTKQQERQEQGEKLMVPNHFQEDEETAFVEPMSCSYLLVNDAAQGKQDMKNQNSGNDGKKDLDIRKQNSSNRISQINGRWTYASIVRGNLKKRNDMNANDSKYI